MAQFVINLLAAPADLAGIGFQHPSMIPHGGGLAHAVGADEPEHLPLGDGERQVVEGDQVTAAAAYTLEVQHVASLHIRVAIKPSAAP